MLRQLAINNSHLYYLSFYLSSAMQSCRVLLTPLTYFHVGDFGYIASYAPYVAALNTNKNPA
jgi:hypothetical protein